MNPYSNLCDDFYVTMNLSTEMDLPDSRERATVLHFFEQIQKKYPSMHNFYCRDKGDFVLEEDKDEGKYRWCAIEMRRICSGHVNPDSVESAIEQHRFVLEAVPYTLSVSPLDCEALDLLYGFDFNCRGNHSQLVAEALGVSPAMEPLISEALEDENREHGSGQSDGGESNWRLRNRFPGARILSFEPSLTMVLDDECRVQCRLSIENRTTAYHLRTGEFPEDQLSVYVTARQYGSLETGDSFEASLDRLAEIAHDMVENYVVDQVLKPLHSTISLK